MPRWGLPISLDYFLWNSFNNFCRILLINTKTFGKLCIEVSYKNTYYFYRYTYIVTLLYSCVSQPVPMGLFLCKLNACCTSCNININSDLRCVFWLSGNSNMTHISARILTCWGIVQHGRVYGYYENSLINITSLRLKVLYKLRVYIHPFKHTFIDWWQWPPAQLQR